MRILLWSALVWLSFANLASARDIYVNNDAGDDRATGDTPLGQGLTGPVSTLTKALRIALPYDRIVLANTGKPYRESVTLAGGRHNGGIGFPFVIEGNGATLDGSTSIPLDWWEPVSSDTFRYLPPKLTYPQLYLDGRPVERVASVGADQPLPKLEPLQWVQHDRWVYFRVEPKKTLPDYDLKQPGADVGITLYKVHHVAILDLTVQGYRLDGINAHDAFTDVTLEGITARGNGRSGIAVAGTGKVVVQASVLGDNGAAQLWVEGITQTFVRASQLLPNSAEPIHKATTTAQVTVADAPAEEPAQEEAADAPAALNAAAEDQ